MAGAHTRCQIGWLGSTEVTFISVGRGAGREPWTCPRESAASGLETHARSARISLRAIRLLTTVPCLAVGLLGQGTQTVVPGDARVDGLKIHAYTRSYVLYEVPLPGPHVEVPFDAPPGPTGARYLRLLERVEVVPVDRDTLIVQTHTRVYNSGVRDSDTLKVHGHTLAPIAQRTTWDAPYPRKDRYVRFRSPPPLRALTSPRAGTPRTSR